jgi:hypothetical protein
MDLAFLKVDMCVNLQKVKFSIFYTKLIVDFLQHINVRILAFFRLRFLIIVIYFKNIDKF